MRKYMGDEELVELPTKKKYSIFDNGDVDCDSFYFYNLAKNQLNRDQFLNKAYNKILSALCYIYKKYKTDIIVIDDCEYLYYWLGDVVYNNLKNKNLFHTVMETLKFLLNNDEGKSICNYNKYNINEHDFVHIKTLFDYSKDYDAIKKHLKKYQEYCNYEYKVLLHKYTTEYGDLWDSCERNDNRYSYCNDFKHFLNWRNRFEFSNLSCTVVQNVHNIEENDLESYEHMKENRLIIKEEQNFNYLISNNSSSYSTSTSIVIGTLVTGITVFCLLTCKFTPVGYWLRKVLQVKSKRKSNIIMDRNITDDYSMLENLYSPRKFNVKYSNT